ncbi:hypothetical protein J1614_007984 [Plenodomus biglobosus]|nr:hypothetical protein J1614_007984 [Plenodomus biglobosus]
MRSWFGLAEVPLLNVTMMSMTRRYLNGTEAPDCRAPTTIHSRYGSPQSPMGNHFNVVDRYTPHATNIKAVINEPVFG